jgi:methanogenic corrinoid protein MtbC1
MIFKSSGWTVHDMGMDVAAERFGEEQTRTKPEMVD